VRAGGAEVVVRVVGIHGAHKRRHGRVAQPPNRPHCDRQLAQPRKPPLGLARLAEPACDQESDRQLRQPVGQGEEEAERGQVAPVRVVDGDRERSVLGQVRDEPVKAVLEGERRVRAGADGATLEERAGEPSRPRQQLVALGRICGGQPPLEELQRQPERKGAFDLDAARGEQLKPALGRSLRARVEQPGLARARIALHDEQPTAAFTRARE